MSVFRKNTLVVDFSVLPKRPDAGQVQQFLEKYVKLQLADTTTIQLHNIRNCVYIETVNNETALRYEAANHYKHTIICNKKPFKIPVYVESEAVTVRVHDLPTHTPHQTVTDYMGQYGVVISITREKWKNHFPGYYNGVRVLRMKLNRPIPSCVTIDGEITLVTYRNQPKTCHHCGKAAHPKQKCAKTTPAASSSKIPSPPPCGSSGPHAQLNEDEYPSLSPASNEGAHTQQTKNNNENNTNSGNGDDCDDDDDDGNDDDDGIDDDGGDNDDGDNDTGEDDDGNDSSDSNGFIEATNRKRRPRRVLSQQLNEMKKKCINQSSQNLEQSCNRFQALVEIEPVCPSTREMEEYLNRSKQKQLNCNSST